MRKSKKLLKFGFKLIYYAKTGTGAGRGCLTGTMTQHSGTFWGTKFW